MKFILDDRLTLLSEPPKEYPLPESGTAIIQDLYKAILTQNGSAVIQAGMVPIDVNIQVKGEEVRVTIVRKGEKP